MKYTESSHPIANQSTNMEGIQRVYELPGTDGYHVSAVKLWRNTNPVHYLHYGDANTWEAALLDSDGLITSGDEPQGWLTDEQLEAFVKTMAEVLGNNGPLDTVR